MAIVSSMIRERAIEPKIKSNVGDWKRIFYNPPNGKNEKAVSD